MLRWMHRLHYKVASPDAFDQTATPRCDMAMDTFVPVARLPRGSPEIDGR